MSETAVPEKGGREPILNPVDRISEMLFGLFMALLALLNSPAHERYHRRLETGPFCPLD